VRVSRTDGPAPVRLPAPEPAREVPKGRRRVAGGEAFRPSPRLTGQDTQSPGGAKESVPASPAACAASHALSSFQDLFPERAGSGGLRPRLLAFDPSGLLCGTLEFRGLTPPATCFRPFGSSLRSARVPAACAAGYLLSTLWVFSAERSPSGGLRCRLLAFDPSGLLCGTREFRRLAPPATCFRPCGPEVAVGGGRARRSPYFAVRCPGPKARKKPAQACLRQAGRSAAQARVRVTGKREP